MKNILTDKHFEILGVSKQSTKDEIKKAYRKQSKLWHPDKFSNDISKWNEAHLRFVEIAEAFELLQNYQPPKLNDTPKTKESTYKFTQKTKTERANISRTRVKSSNVFAIGYDKERKILQVEFKKGSIYEYYDVPESVFNEFMNAESKGRFMGNLYKYKYRQV